MLGIYAEYAQQFLFVVATVSTLCFALPLFLAPLGWARAMRFEIPVETDLAVYFGRCLGAVALVLVGLAFVAASSGVALRLAFQIFFAVAVLMILVHVYGAVRRIQPVTETIEIGFWVLLAVLCLVFFPVSLPA